MLVISDIWLRLFFQNVSIWEKIAILGQPPRSFLVPKKGKDLFFKVPHFFRRPNHATESIDQKEK